MALAGAGWMASFWSSAGVGSPTGMGMAGIFSQPSPLVGLADAPGAGGDDAHSKPVHIKGPLLNFRQGGHGGDGSAAGAGHGGSAVGKGQDLLQLLGGQALQGLSPRATRRLSTAPRKVSPAPLVSATVVGTRAPDRSCPASGRRSPYLPKVMSTRRTPSASSGGCPPRGRWCRSSGELLVGELDEIHQGQGNTHPLLGLLLGLPQEAR